MGLHLVNKIHSEEVICRRTVSRKANQKDFRFGFECIMMMSSFSRNFTHSKKSYQKNDCHKIGTNRSSQMVSDPRNTRNG